MLFQLIDELFEAISAFKAVKLFVFSCLKARISLRISPIPRFCVGCVSCDISVIELLSVNVTSLASKVEGVREVDGGVRLVNVLFFRTVSSIVDSSGLSESIWKNIRFRVSFPALHGVSGQVETEFFLGRPLRGLRLARERLFMSEMTGVDDIDPCVIDAERGVSARVVRSSLPCKMAPLLTTLFGITKQTPKNAP